MRPGLSGAVQMLADKLGATAQDDCRILHYAHDDITGRLHIPYEIHPFTAGFTHDRGAGY